MADLVERTLDAGAFEEIDYLNVNSPRPDRPIKTIEVTRPTPKYGMDAEVADDEFRLRFDSLERFGYGEQVDPPGSDLRAVAEGRISISPLDFPADYQRSDRLGAVVDELV